MEWYMIKMYAGLHVKYPLLLSDLNETWIFSIDFSKNNDISNLMKILPVRAELFHADRRIYVDDESNICFSQFCERA